MNQWHCGCCSLKAGCRFGALWTMIEALAGIALLVAAGLLGNGNALAVAATCYFVLMFCSAWVLLAGIFREATSIIFTWCALYGIFILIRIALLGFAVAGYIEFANHQPVTYEIAYLADGQSLSSQRDNVEKYLPGLIGVIAILGVSIVLSGWILIGMVYYGVGIRRHMWRRARLEYSYY